jgi:hypothetical protein
MDWTLTKTYQKFSKDRGPQDSWWSDGAGIGAKENCFK